MRKSKLYDCYLMVFETSSNNEFRTLDVRLWEFFDNFRFFFNKFREKV